MCNNSFKVKKTKKHNWISHVFNRVETEKFDEQNAKREQFQI